MCENADQHELTLGPDGSITLPGAPRWPGMQLLVEQTDDVLLVTEIEVPRMCNSGVDQVRFGSQHDYPLRQDLLDALSQLQVGCRAWRTMKLICWRLVNRLQHSHCWYSGQLA